MKINSSESLNERLYFLRKEIEKQCSDEINKLTEESIEELIAYDVESKALKVGDMIPTVSLSNAVGKKVLLSPENSSAPTIILFYRGGWCPYCNIELNYYQENLSYIKSKGCEFVAISPELPDNSLNLKEKENLEFEILSDIKSELGSKFGIAAPRPSAFITMIAKLGLNLSDSYGSEGDHLPIPSRFLVDASGKILYRSFNPNYRERVDLDEVLGLL